jgi:DNA end-binding protein Ku
MPRVWKGAISFGLVAVPVVGHTATEDKDVRFHQVHRVDGGRVRYKKVCEADGSEVESSDIVRGFGVGGGEIVMLEDSDLADLPLPTAHMIDVHAFVPADQIDPIMYDKPYYLEPEGPAALRAYALMRDALQKSNLVGIAKVAIRAKEQLAAIRVYERVIVLSTLLWPDEVRDPHELKNLPDASDEPHPNEHKMTQQLVESLAGDFDADDKRFRDGYRRAVLEVIKAKQEGREVIEAPLPAAEVDGKAVDLMSALKASVERARQSHAEADPVGPTAKKVTGRALKAVPAHTEPEPKGAPKKTAAKKAPVKKVAKPRKSA